MELCLKKKMEKYKQELTTKFPWGNVSMVSWGDPAKQPILFVHGYMDSAATFMPLLEILPDNYYYVAIDLPGHGKSEPYPSGMTISQTCNVEVLRGVVEHLKWNSFVYIGHSFAFVTGLLYNHIYPGKIIRMIYIDPAPPLATHYFSLYEPDVWYSYIYGTFYERFDKFATHSPKAMSYEEAIGLMIENRRLTEKQAEVILCRSLIPVENNKFRLSWDPRMKLFVNVPLSEDILHKIITDHSIPMLIIEASENISNFSGQAFAAKVLEKFCRMKYNCFLITVDGGHDVHITNPDVVAPHIVYFLSGAVQNYISKL